MIKRKAIPFTIYNSFGINLLAMDYRYFDKNFTKANLIIHPKDSSTDFLKPCYARISNKLVITGGLDQIALYREISKHERVMMMGHGTGSGLLNVRQFPNTSTYVISKRFIEPFFFQEENIYIWCYANEFVKTHQLKGFYTGMFISELVEAWAHGFQDISQYEIDESNKLFSEIIASSVHLGKFKMLETLKLEYGKLSKFNPIAAFNVSQLYAS